MADIVFTCSKCKTQIEVDDSFAGNAAQCPNCDNTVLIPRQGIREGMKIGDFEIVRRLGAGGMGEVWLSYQATMDRHVALKILSPALARNEQFVSRFMEEVKTSAKLQHPNIVTAFYAGVDRGIYYLAISYVDGMELEDWLKIDGVIPEEKALKIIRSIATALQYAWNKFKILHRDIKPTNIMIAREDGEAHLMDMGISKSMAEDKNLTMTGMIVGTPYYMSPEQARGEENLDCRSDIYSLGATFYHIVTGEVPYDSANTMGILAKLITDPFPPPQEKNPDLSDQCAALLEIMIAKNSGDRQQTWEEVIKDVDQVMDGKSPLTKRPPSGKSLVLEKTSKEALSKQENIKKPPRAKRSKVIEVTAPEEEQQADKNLGTREVSTGRRRRHKSKKKTQAEEAYEEAKQITAQLCSEEKYNEAFITWHNFLLRFPNCSHAAEINDQIKNLKDKHYRGPILGKEWVIPDLELTLVPIKEGEFRMGSPPGSLLGLGGERGRKKNEGPLHNVTISKPFWMGRYPVTIGEFLHFINSSEDDREILWTPKSCSLNKAGMDNHVGNGNWGDMRQPMIEINWNTAVTFCKWLTKREMNSNRLLEGHIYRLPTEAEWEYCCRAGTISRFYFGDDDGKLGNFAWYKNNSNGKTQPVGEKEPNQWGLYDMHGNVWEWCQDKYGEYPNKNVTDPYGPVSGFGYVRRGGSWINDTSHCRCAYRNYWEAKSIYSYLGLRIVLAPIKKSLQSFSRF